MRTADYTGQFKKDYKLAAKRGPEKARLTGLEAVIAGAGGKLSPHRYHRKMDFSQSLIQGRSV
jgi:mRNA-degrading endonuclease YafQ of YafQ-DinJ toxin-antitoxin module